jgi:hypothetical protein
MMIKQYSIFFIASICYLFTNTAKAQVTLDSFFGQIKNFVAANYSKKNLDVIKKWSDSNYISSNSKKKIKQIWYRGNLKTKEGANIDFVFFSSELTAIGEKKCNGTILINYKGDCNAALLRSVLGYIPKYYMNFDTVKVAGTTTCSCNEIRLHFNNYNVAVNQVLETVDTSLTALLKHEYFDFYFANVNQKGSTWQAEFKTFMQPYSEALIEMLRMGKLKSIFEIIALKNKGYSWSLAEGLWYYNSLYSVLTKEQVEIVESYNDKKGMLPFRHKDELKIIYKF